MTEQRYQAKLIKLFEARGFYVLKLEKTNKNGIPDLLALKKGESPIFIEVKARRGRPSHLQLFRLEELEECGFEAHLTYYGDLFVENMTKRFEEEPQRSKNSVVHLSKPFEDEEY